MMGGGDVSRSPCIRCRQGSGRAKAFHRRVSVGLAEIMEVDNEGGRPERRPRARWVG